VTLWLALSGFFNALIFFRTRKSGLIQGNPDDNFGMPHVIQDEEQTVLRRTQEDARKMTSIHEENPASLENRQGSSSGAGASSGQRISRSQVSGGLAEDSDSDYGRLPA
jgi:hypothetical protein